VQEVQQLSSVSKLISVRMQEFLSAVAQVSSRLVLSYLACLSYIEVAAYSVSIL